jgi:hypothetical protein
MGVNHDIDQRSVGEDRLALDPITAVDAQVAHGTRFGRIRSSRHGLRGVQTPLAARNTGPVRESDEPRPESESEATAEEGVERTADGLCTDERFGASGESALAYSAPLARSYERTELSKAY